MVVRIEGLHRRGDWGDRAALVAVIGACAAALALGLAAPPDAPARTDQPAGALVSTVSGDAASVSPVQPHSDLGAPHDIPNRYRADVLKVIDGDTFEARVALWLGHFVVTRVRLAGIDAPERRAACPEARDRAERARRQLSELVTAGPVLLSDVRHDKYAGRVVASVRDAAGRDPAAVLLAADLARPMQRARRARWCDGG